ncbi:MAG TPA: DUF6232 family protein, partial [Micromonosporaceae bacterium]
GRGEPTKRWREGRTMGVHLSMGVTMATLFRDDGLCITDDWIRARPGTFAISEVRTAWVTRRQVGRGSRVLTAVLGIVAVLAVIGTAGLTGWLTHNWWWILAAPVIFFLAAAIGLLDPVAIYLEKRHHELWITTNTTAVRLWKHNSVEVNKALRAIHRACERHRERYEV